MKPTEEQAERMYGWTINALPPWSAPRSDDAKLKAEIAKAYTIRNPSRHARDCDVKDAKHVNAAFEIEFNEYCLQFFFNGDRLLKAGAV